MQIGDVELAFAAELGGLRRVELAGLAAASAEIEQRLAGEIEHVDAMIADIGQVEPAVTDVHELRLHVLARLASRTR